jgi:hypothetical protein
MSNVDFLELSQEEEMEFVTQVKKLEDTNNLLSSSLDDLTISQIAENMENEHFVFQEMEDLSISQTMDQYLPGGVFSLDFPMCDEKFDLNEVDHSRFVKPVSDEELKSLVENQENVNTKNNTKWAINVFNK